MTKSHIRTLVIVLEVIALLAAAVPAAAGQAVERPIRENLTGHVIGFELSPNYPAGDTFDGRCSEASQWVTTSTGSGVCSHLGRVTWVEEHCFVEATGRLYDDFMGPDGTKNPQADGLIGADGLHPTDAGAQRIAELIHDLGYGLAS